MAKKRYLASVLVVASSPEQRGHTGWRQEYDRIIKGIQDGKFGTAIQVLHPAYSSTEDLTWAIRSEQPDIIHVIAHGKSEGIELLTKDGDIQTADANWFQRVINHECSLVVHACHSEGFRHLPEHSDKVRSAIYVAGLVDIETASSVSFSLYRALANGATMKEAYEISELSVLSDYSVGIAGDGSLRLIHGTRVWLWKLQGSPLLIILASLIALLLLGYSLYESRRATCDEQGERLLRSWRSVEPHILPHPGRAIAPQERQALDQNFTSVANEWRKARTSECMEPWRDDEEASCVEVWEGVFFAALIGLVNDQNNNSVESIIDLLEGLPRECAAQTSDGGFWQSGYRRALAYLLLSRASLLARGDPEQAQYLLERASSLPIDDKNLEAKSSIASATISLHNNDPQGAIHALQHIVDEGEPSIPPTTYGEACRLMSLALIEEMNYAKASDYAARAADAGRATGSLHLQERAYVAQGLAVESLRDRSEAGRLFEQAIVASERLHRAQHFRTVTARLELARFLSRGETPLERKIRAVNEFKRALALAEVTLGPTHTSTTRVRRAYAAHLYEIDQQEKAIDEQVRVVKSYETHELDVQAAHARMVLAVMRALPPEAPNFDERDCILVEGDTRTYQSRKARAEQLQLVAICWYNSSDDRRACESMELAIESLGEASLLSPTDIEHLVFFHGNAAEICSSLLEEARFAVHFEAALDLWSSISSEARPKLRQQFLFSLDRYATLAKCVPSRPLKVLNAIEAVVSPSTLRLDLCVIE